LPYLFFPEFDINPLGTGWTACRLSSGGNGCESRAVPQL
jgi:hypothetical protein